MSSTCWKAAWQPSPRRSPLLGRVAKSLNRGDGEQRAALRPVLVGLLIAAPFLCGFTMLFSSADLLFDKLLRDAFDAVSFADLFGHAVIWGMLSWMMMGLLTYAVLRSPEEEILWGLLSPGSRKEVDQDAEDDPAAAEIALVEAAQAETKVAHHIIGWVEATVALFSINALFVMFVAVQAAALFGGDAFLEAQGLTYSEYARSGFFQLLTVALIVLSLLLALDFLTKRDAGRARTFFMLGSGLMITLTVVILYSAFTRMALYEQAFGFTHLRLQTHVFMVWLALLLVFFLASLIVNQTRLFATGALIFVVGVVGTLDLLNQDVWIVRRNIARYERGEELDVPYLGSLSADAVPYLIPLLYDYDQETGAQIGPWLHWHLDELDERRAEGGWPASHLAMTRAYRALDANRGLIEQFNVSDRAFSYSYGF